MPEIVIESKSHAIKPLIGKALRDDVIYRVYQPNSYKIENMGDWSEYKLSQIKHELKRTGGVSWLDEQFDTDLRNKTATGKYRSMDLQHLPGDIVNDPGKLFRIGMHFNR